MIKLLGLDKLIESKIIYVKDIFWKFHEYFTIEYSRINLELE